MASTTLRKQLIVFGALSFASLLTVGCGDASKSSDSETSIYGGKATAQGEFYGAVALTNRYMGAFCSGTAITPTVVITAAHCVDILETPSDNFVYVGSGKEQGQFLGQFQVKSAKANPNYNPWASSGQNDIAYVVLAEPIPLPATAFVPVLTKKSEVAEVIRTGKTARVIGFGDRSDRGYGVKYQVDAPITRVGSNEIGIGGNGKDSCQGDSGGPAYGQLANGQWRVFGVVSRGGSCGSGGIYGLMHANICWVQKDSGINLGLAKGTCDGINSAVSASRPE
ncbi:MAG: trypsin-like serine protease [Bdellovibrionota bacterium]